MLLHARSTCWVVGGRNRDAGGVRRVAGGGWRVAGGGWQVAAAEIMTLIYIIVWILSLARPPRRNLAMPHDHGVDNCSLRFCRNGRQLDLGESWSPTQIFQRNLLLASHRLWVYVCAFGPGMMVMMVMVMMVMVMTAMLMVSVMVIIVPEALKQAGWLRQR